MGIFRWFTGRSVDSERPAGSAASAAPDGRLEKAVNKAIDTVVTLTNPRLKLLAGYRDRLDAPVRETVEYLRDQMYSLPSIIDVSPENWSEIPLLRAFFANARDIPRTLGASGNLRTFFAKNPSLNEAYCVLGVAYHERRTDGMSPYGGGGIRTDISRKVASFSSPWIKICGRNEAEVRKLLNRQLLEYLASQSLVGIEKSRSGRQELENHRALIRARQQILQLQSNSWDTNDVAPPTHDIEYSELEAALAENARQLDAMGNSQALLETELEYLCKAFESSQHYLRLERKQFRLSHLNEVLETDSPTAGSDVDFMLMTLDGEPKAVRAFFIGRVARSELPAAQIDFGGAERLL